MSIRSLTTRIALAFVLVAPQSFAPALVAAGTNSHAGQSNWQHGFAVTSAQFENDTTIPQVSIFNGTAGNVCTGGDESPELSWTNPPFGTQSFAVMTYDVTASFTHWGMYNIDANRRHLPLNAGVADSNFGQQIFNDFGDQHYDGPCPPPGLVHRYQFSVYALDTVLPTLGSADFPANGSALLHAMIGHIIDHATITGLYETH
jgi:Raf kinase inhibitor-like YbhB/YbcL family protein